MIRTKTKEEIEILREGGKILANIIENIGKKIQSGVSTGDLEKLAEKMMKEAGGRPAFKNLMMPDGRPYPSVLCTSIDNEVVHAPAIPARVLKHGQIIKIDIGMEYPLTQEKRAGRIVNKYSDLGGYYTDMAKTFIVGDASDEIKKFVKTTEECLQIGIEQARPGNSLNDIGKSIQRHAESNGYSVVRDMVGHGVGHDVHESPQVPHFEVKDGSMPNAKLRPGMVIAIEPMINMGGWRIMPDKDGFTWVTVDGSLSAQFEHTIAITEKGPVVLTEI